MRIALPIPAIMGSIVIILDVLHHTRNDSTAPCWRHLREAFSLPERLWMKYYVWSSQGEDTPFLVFEQINFFASLTQSEEHSLKPTPQHGYALTTKSSAVCHWIPPPSTHHPAPSSRDGIDNPIQCLLNSLKTPTHPPLDQ